jgi:hypothetical protein
MNDAQRKLIDDTKFVSQEVFADTLLAVCLKDSHPVDAYQAATKAKAGAEKLAGLLQELIDLATAPIE